MPPITRIKKEDVIDVAYDIVRESGIDCLNARCIAKKLNCSIQPIFYNFKTMEDLKKKLYEKIILKYREYMLDNLDSKTPYKQMGINYIKFAKEEPKLFQIMFMTPTNLTPEKFISCDKSFSDVERYAGDCTKLSNEQIKKFHVKMWIFTHGIATLVASQTCDFTQKQIDDLLLDEYKALIKLEGDNK